MNAISSDHRRKAGGDARLLANGPTPTSIERTGQAFIHAVNVALAAGFSPMLAEDLRSFLGAVEQVIALAEATHGRR